MPRSAAPCSMTAIASVARQRTSSAHAVISRVQQTGRGVQIAPAVLGDPDRRRVQMPELISALDAEEPRPSAPPFRATPPQQPLAAHEPLHALAVDRTAELAARERRDHPVAVGRVRERDRQHDPIDLIGRPTLRARRTYRTALDRLATNRSDPSDDRRRAAVRDHSRDRATRSLTPSRARVPPPPRPPSLCAPAPTPSATRPPSSSASVRSRRPCRRSAPAVRNCSRHSLSRLSAISCSRPSSAIDFGPRSEASTISVFCWAVSLRYLRVSLIDPLDRLSGPSSERPRTQPRRLRRLAPTRNHLTEPSTTSRGPRQATPRDRRRASRTLQSTRPVANLTSARGEVSRRTPPPPKGPVRG